MLWIHERLDVLRCCFIVSIRYQPRFHRIWTNAIVVICDNTVGLFLERGGQVWHSNSHSKFCTQPYLLTHGNWAQLKFWVSGLGMRYWEHIIEFSSNFHHENVWQQLAVMHAGIREFILEILLLGFHCREFRGTGVCCRHKQGVGFAHLRPHRQLLMRIHSLGSCHLGSFVI